MVNKVAESHIDLVVFPLSGPTAHLTRTTPTNQDVRVSVVIPTLNEARNLPFVLPGIPPWVHEVIIVDGHSTDGTPDVARQYWPAVRILHADRRGKGVALRAGFEAATGDIIVMLDADGSMNPAEIPAYVGMLIAGADFAKGSRFAQGGGTADMTSFRWVGNWLFVQTTRMLFGGQYSDLCYGYNAFWRRVLPALSLDGDGFEIETMMNLRGLTCQLKIVEVPSFEAERIHGTSNLRTMPDGWRVLKTICREWWSTGRFQPRFRAPRTMGYATKAAHSRQLHSLQHGKAE